MLINFQEKTQKL